MISHHPTSFCSVISKEWCFHHKRNYLTQLVKWWPASSRRLWLPCLNTGRRDWNVCLRTIVITIHKLSVGSFTVLQCLSGTESLNLRGTPYRSHFAFVNLPHSHLSVCTGNGVHCKHYTLSGSCINKDSGDKIWLDFITWFQSSYICRELLAKMRINERWRWNREKSTHEFIWRSGTK
jgi:hypothetical protein